LKYDSIGTTLLEYKAVREQRSCLQVVVSNQLKSLH